MESGNYIIELQSPIYQALVDLFGSMKNEYSKLLSEINTKTDQIDRQIATNF